MPAAVSAGADQTICEMNKENSKISVKLSGAAYFESLWREIDTCVSISIQAGSI